MTKEERKTSRLQIRVNDVEKKRIEEDAAKMHLSVASYVRFKLLASSEK